MSAHLIMLLLASAASASAAVAVFRRHEPSARRLLIVSALLLTVGTAVDLLMPKPGRQPDAGFRALEAMKQENAKRQAKLDSLNAELTAIQALDGKLGPANNRGLSDIAADLNELRQDLARRRY